MILVVINATLVEAGKTWKIIIDPHKSALSWPDSSTGGALHRHREGQGSSPVQAWIFRPYPLLLK